MTEQIVKVSPSSLEKALKSNEPVHLIDVRSPAEYRAVHVEGAENWPLDQLNDEKLIQLKERDGELFFICAAGTRSQSACEKAVNCGLPRIHTVEGGTTACQKAGLEVIQTQSVLSLERQVRVAAGLLVLLGSIGSLAIAPGFIGLAIFVGAGLVFAGLTDWCGMGLLLARMPWNK